MTDLPEKSGNRFEALVTEHLDTLYRVAYRLTGSKADAEDLVQDVCLRALPRLDEIARLEQPRGWLLRVMYRAFIDTQRKRQRSPVELMGVLAVTDDSPAMASSTPGPEQSAEGSQTGDRLARAWRHLTGEQRALLALHDVEGYSLAELEEMTGVTGGTLKSRLHRARVRLGRLLQREETPISLAVTETTDV